MTPRLSHPADASPPVPESSTGARAAEPAVMPLSAARPGQELVLVGVEGGRGLRQRLAEMGLLEGCRLTVLSAGRGPMVVEVRGSRLVLGHGTVGRIRVRPAGGT